MVKAWSSYLLPPFALSRFDWCGDEWHLIERSHLVTLGFYHHEGFNIMMKCSWKPLEMLCNRVCGFKFIPVQSLHRRGWSIGWFSELVELEKGHVWMYLWLVHTDSMESFKKFSLWPGKIQCYSINKYFCSNVYLLLLTPY